MLHRGPFTRFDNDSTRRWFEERGVPLKTEKDGRVFPKSDQSSSIVGVLQQEAARLNVRVSTGWRVKGLQADEAGFHLSAQHPEGVAELRATHVLLASGSDRKAWALCEQLGHRIVPPVPSLFTFPAPEDADLRALQGLSCPTALKLRVQASASGKAQTFTDAGPLLFTHWGVSGPAVIRMSSWAARAMAQAGYQAALTCDFAEGVPTSAIEAELLALKKGGGPRDRVGAVLPPAIRGRVPRRLWHALVLRAGIDANQQLYRETRDASLRQVAARVKATVVAVAGRTAYKEEFVTAGGVDLRDVDMRTMESRLVPRLHFAGEALNVDGETGGYNFQNAWTTAWLAAQGIAREIG